MTHAGAVAWTLAGFVLLGVSFFGWGKLASHLLQTRLPSRADEATTILVGWSSALLVLQTSHLVAPVSYALAYVVLGAGCVMSVPALRRFFHTLPDARPSRRDLTIATGVLAAALWVISKGMYQVENFDSGLYHLSAIRWINTYPIVPGLGNLHGRLAFNQSFFTYAAALNASWFAPHARSAANGFLLLVVLLQAIQGSRRPKASLLFRASCLLTIPVLAYLALSTDGLTSPTPDLAVTLLQLSLFMIFIRGVAEWLEASDRIDSTSIALALLAATAITVKLSSIAFSAAILAACLLWRLRAPRESRAARISNLRWLALTGAVLAIWLARGVVLSGCPLYPSSAGCVRVDWAVPIPKVVEMGNWVYSWSRMPGADWHSVLGSWRWLTPWFERVTRDYLGVIYPLAAAFVFLASSITVRKRGASVTIPGRWRDFVILIPPVAGIVFWFFTAPDPRFGRVFFWMLATGAAALLVRSFERRLDHRPLRIVAGLVGIVASAPFIAYAVAKGPSRLELISMAGWQAIPRPDLTEKRAASGLPLYLPPADKCWDESLLCTPVFNAAIELRKQGNIGGGFRDQTYR